MRALTVRQPWAWAIIHGGKDVENRVRSLGPYRGPVAIHAGLALDHEYDAHLIGKAVGRADDKGHISCPAARTVSEELGQFLGRDLPALNAHGHDGRALADVGEDGLALLFQRLFHHGGGSVLLFDLFLRQRIISPVKNPSRRTLSQVSEIP